MWNIYMAQNKLFTFVIVFWHNKIKTWYIVRPSKFFELISVPKKICYGFWFVWFIVYRNCDKFIIVLKTGYCAALNTRVYDFLLTIVHGMFRKNFDFLAYKFQKCLHHFKVHVCGVGIYKQNQSYFTYHANEERVKLTHYQNYVTFP